MPSDRPSRRYRRGGVCNEFSVEPEAPNEALTQHTRVLSVSIDKRMMAKIAAGGVAALAATTISAAPSALADPPPTPVPPAPDTATAAAPGPVPHLYNPNN